MDGSDPNQTAIQLAQTPAKQAIAQQIHAMNNAATSTPLVLERNFTHTMKELVETVDSKLATFANSINLNTDRRTTESTETLKTHALNMHNVMGNFSFGVSTF